MTATATPEVTVPVEEPEPWPPLDDRDLRRLRDQARLLQLAVEGLLAQESGAGSAHRRLLGHLDRAATAAATAVEQLGLAQVALLETTGGPA